jgi:hypothetical protein
MPLLDPTWHEAIRRRRRRRSAVSGAGELQGQRRSGGQGRPGEGERRGTNGEKEAALGGRKPGAIAPGRPRRCLGGGRSGRKGDGEVNAAVWDKIAWGNWINALKFHF